ncbi:hypothetical protein, partial [Streptomyces sp. NPDC012746]|uniref:hypothetical protein n=1 Tax=Streptomyces sp. NPDC012746 TaxID=3364845 RepID=UPI0036AA2401
QLLALIFGTLLSSQGTDASFVLTLAGFPPGFRSSFLRFRLYQSQSRSLSRFFAFAFSLSGDSNLTRSFPRRFRLGFEFGGRWRAFPFRVDQTLSGLPEC